MDECGDTLRCAGVEKAACESGARIIGPGCDVAPKNPAKQVFLGGGPRDGVPRQFQGITDGDRGARRSLPYP